MSISIIFARGILAEIQNRGFEPEPLLRQCSIEPARLLDLRGVMTLEETNALVSLALQVTGDPGLGLTVGVRAPESMLQVLGQLLVSQVCIRDAFATLHRYSALLDDGPVWGLAESSSLATFTCEPAFQLGDTTRLGMDFMLAMALRIGRHFLPPGVTLTRVHCMHPAPSYTQRYADIFECPVEFNKESYALVFPREYLDRPQLHADRTMSTELARTAEELMAARLKRNSVTQRVRTFLRHERHLSEVDVTRISRHVGLSVRGLRRRLSVEGTTISALVDEARCRVARDRLSRSDTSIKETAELLGFSEASSFHRAFKRWTGATAGTYRRSADSV